MIKSDNYRHIEYLYPDSHWKGFWGRIIIFIVVIIIEAILFTITIRTIMATSEGRAFALLLMMMLVILPPPVLWMFRDFSNLFSSPVRALKILGKVIISREGIAIIKGKHLIRKLKWKDIEIIEKSRQDGEKVLTLITNTMNDKIAKCSDKRKNYIEIPARDTLEMAVRKFSGKDITIADPSLNRFILN